MLGEIVEQDAELLRTDPQAFALSMLAKVGVSLENMNVTIQGINTFLLVKDTIMYYVGSNASLAEKISSGGEATGTLVITLIALGADLASLDKEGIATLMEGIKTGDLSAATLARACGDTKQMAKAAQTFFQKEAAEQIADMSISQARYLLKTGEQAYRATGGTIRLGKTEILKLLDNFADDIAADIAAETLAAQLGRTRTMEAIESVLDKTTFEAIKDTIEGRGLEQAELEKLNQVIRGYSLQEGEQMSTTQIRGLLKDGSWLTKSVDDVVAELVRFKFSIDDVALKHSTLGDFTFNPKTGEVSRMKGGGHGQSNIDFLEANGMEYNIVKVYDNGVRVGNVPKHKEKLKRTGTNQSWFPQNWSESDIIDAGTYVGSLPENRNVVDGVAVFGEYNGVRVGVVRTDGRISTIYPDAELQP